MRHIMSAWLRKARGARGSLLRGYSTKLQPIQLNSDISGCLVSRKEEFDVLRLLEYFNTVQLQCSLKEWEY